jgi:hypothetical protein
MMNWDRWAEMCAVFETSRVLKRSVTPAEMTDFSVLKAIYPPAASK